MASSTPRILIARLSALGDIIHALPLLAALRDRFPEAHLGWLVEPAGRQLLEGHPLLDRLHLVPRKAMKENFWAAVRGPMRDLVRELRAERYDIFIDVQGLTKSAIWGWLAGIPRRIGFTGAEARELAGLLATERVSPPAGALHVVRRNLALLTPMGIDLALAPVERLPFPVHLPQSAREKAATLLGLAADPTDSDARAVGEGSAADLAVLPDASHPLVIMNPGAGWATKIWAPERYGQLARRLVDRYQVRVAFAWGPGEQPLVEQALKAAEAHNGRDKCDCDCDTDHQHGRGVADPLSAISNLKSEIRNPQSAIPFAPGVYPLPATTFMELAAIIARASLFVGGDTGPTHLAAALGVPTVAMMGPLDARRNGPLGRQCVTIQHGVPRKAPCWANHRRWCDPVTDLRHVTVEEVCAPCGDVLERLRIEQIGGLC